MKIRLEPLRMSRTQFDLDLFILFFLFAEVTAAVDLHLLTSENELMSRSSLYYTHITIFCLVFQEIWASFLSCCRVLLTCKHESTIIGSVNYRLVCTFWHEPDIKYNDRHLLIIIEIDLTYGDFKEIHLLYVCTFISFMIVLVFNNFMWL